jgi:hypothetical protein
MKHSITHENIRHIHGALKKVRFMQFGHKAYRHCDKDVSRVRAEWSEFQKNPVGYLASSHEDLSRDILTLCQ